MDSSLYKTIQTSRKLKYSVYHVEPTDASKPTILLVHGFPSSSYDFRHQAAFFKLRGYGILAPDMLGYGASSKPLDAVLYASTAVAQDVVEVVNATAGSGPVVAIGHDWGCRIVSRLANLHTERFLGFAFLAISYMAPNPELSYAQLLAYTAKLAGYELFGYWAFFSEGDADQVIKENYDKFYTAIVAFGPEEIKAHFVGTGALRAWLLDGKPHSLSIPDSLTKEEFGIQKRRFFSTGVAASLNWYKINTSSIDLEDSKTVPKEKYNISKPVFYGACDKEVIGVPALGKGAIQKYCSNATIRDYDSGHWVLWEAKDKLNADLEGWVQTL
ncbi:hypothetical protein NLJ89_g1859 [Agrocybe chaxingu]|uniref:AB hydrolase-1 domain-containing protein n=1 Tax=Agrocybe chaxingu TaxID=84603 RepID=A0A9W8MZ87_9AGAR|nr:hypothetical protein NLJ89_g1859 [Agrocybe chaxingu]